MAGQPRLCKAKLRLLFCRIGILSGFLYGKNKHHAVVEIEYAARNRCRMNKPIRITINHLQTLYFYLCV